MIEIPHLPAKERRQEVIGEVDQLRISDEEAHPEPAPGEAPLMLHVLEAVQHDEEAHPGHNLRENYRLGVREHTCVYSK